MTFDNAFSEDLERIITAALAEDNAGDDVTSRLTIPENMQGEMSFVAREAMTACGLFVPEAVFRSLGKIKIEVLQKEGTAVTKGTVLVKASGAARVLLTGERVTLNIMQRMCGVATQTHRYVDEVKGTKAIVLDTRKTIPGFRTLDKYAVRTGGGQNHRMNLSDMVLIKDNHIAVCGGITAAVAKARAGTKVPVEVECDTLEQVAEALVAKADRILLDNMTLEQLRQAVKLVNGKVKLEASGGINLKTINAVAATGVDYISIGALTHSVPAVDIGADMVIKNPS